MANYDKSFWIKLHRDIYIYDFINGIDINKDKIKYIFKNFYNFKCFINYCYLGLI